MQLLAEAQAFLDANFSNVFGLDAGELCKPWGCVPRLWRLTFAAVEPYGGTATAGLPKMTLDKMTVETTAPSTGRGGISGNGIHERDSNATKCFVCNTEKKQCEKGDFKPCLRTRDECEGECNPVLPRA